MALIFFLAWRQSRRLGQAFADTAAWVIGYLGTYSAIVVLHFGRPSMVSLNPESLWTIVPIFGGFVAMKVSHWLWRRRGGHLQPAVHPFAAKHWIRALRAALFGGRPRTPT